MSKIITQNIELFTYAELSDSAQEKAHNDYVVNMDSYELDCTLEDCKEILQFIGVSDPCIYYSGFCSQGDGACFTGYYEYKKGFLKHILSEYPCDTELHAICKQLFTLQAKNFYRLSGTLEHSGRYYHEYCMRFAGYSDNSDLLEVLRDLARYIYKRLENENDYFTSEAYFMEWCIDNDVFFEADGSVYYE